REAQLLTTKVSPRTAMAVITDVGEEKDVHPRKKEPVGARLALAARHVAYGDSIEFAGPSFAGLDIQGDRAILRFRHVGKGLEAPAGDLKGFASAGEDRKFVNGREKVGGAPGVVPSEKGTRPVAVRFGGANSPVVNLWNKDGLPASPFRTDDFPLSTR